jgi:hypothetical protein
LIGNGNLPDNKGTWKLFIKIDGEEPEWFIVCVSHTIRKTGDVENFVVGRYPTKSLACQAVSNVDPMKPEKLFKNGVVDKVKDTSKKYDPSEERWKWRARARYRNEMLHIGYYESKRDASLSLREEMEDLNNLHRRYCDLMNKRARKRKREAEKKIEDHKEDGENIDYRKLQEFMNGTNEPPKKKRKKYRKRERVYLDPMPFYSNMQHGSVWDQMPPVTIKVKKEPGEVVSPRTRKRQRFKQEWFSKCLEVVDSFIQDDMFSPFIDLHRHLPAVRIDCPSTLCRCRDKLASEQYKRIDDFVNEFELIWINCRTYNDPSKAAILIETSHILEKQFYTRLSPIVFDFGDERCNQKWRNAQQYPGGFLSDSEGICEHECELQ